MHPEKYRLNLQLAKNPPAETRRLYIAVQLSPARARVHAKTRGCHGYSSVSSVEPWFRLWFFRSPGRRAAVHPRTLRIRFLYADEQPTYVQVNKKLIILFVHNDAPAY